MDPKEVEYFDKKFDALHSKIEGAKEEVQIVKEVLGDRLQKHKGELIDRIETVRKEVRDQTEKSSTRWAAIHEEVAVHKKESCPDVKVHEKDYHNIPKIIGIVVGIMTAASIGAAFLVWFIGKVAH